MLCTYVRDVTDVTGGDYKYFGHPAGEKEKKRKGKEQYEGNGRDRKGRAPKMPSFRSIDYYYSFHVRKSHTGD